MKNFSTPCMNDKKRENVKVRHAASKPCRQTIDLLKQFARAYRVEPVLQQDFCDYVLN